MQTINPTPSPLPLTYSNVLFVTIRAGGSMDTELDRLHLHGDTPTKSGKKNLKGSFERGMDKLLTMLTPKKRQTTDNAPRKVRVCIKHT